MTKLTMKPIVSLLVSLLIVGSTFAESPVKQITAKDCAEGERFVECGSCEPTCQNDAPMCTLECRPPMCMCEVGKVRHSNGKCVLPAQCEPVNSTVPVLPPVL
uniref:TIL domain-containing protein n=1 Tax=Panagrolaimus sp. ES5 TaxID=591445 RepID=A0AC34GJX2_9BILA